MPSARFLLLFLSLAGLVARSQSIASISELASALASGSLTCRNFVSSQLTLGRSLNPQLKAFISFRDAAALAEADAIDAAGKERSLPLRCVTVVVKDNTDVANVPTTNGADAMRNMTPSADAFVVARLKLAGAVVLGKANMAEMSDSGTKSNSTVGGLCANPWDVRRSCLGSSGGSAAAVAAGVGLVGVGTDTEGSVIGPCSATGLFCLRPSQGGEFDKAREGIYPAFVKQDTLGLMAKSAGDYLAAHDAVYGTNLSITAGSVRRLDGLVIRFLENFYENFTVAPGVVYQPDQQMLRLHALARARLAQLGARVESFRLGATEMLGTLQQVMAATFTKPECSRSCMVNDLNAYLARYGSSGPFRNASDLWTVRHLLPADYVARLNFTIRQSPGDACASNGSCKAYLQARQTVAQIVANLMGNASLLAMPISAKLPQLNTHEPDLAEQISPALNPYTGWPSATLPVGFTPASAEAPEGLPVAVVLMAADNREPLLAETLSAYCGHFCELRKPQISAASRQICNAWAVWAAVCWAAAAAASSGLAPGFVGRL